MTPPDASSTCEELQAENAALRERLERLTREAEAGRRARAALATLTEFVALLTPDGRVIDCNPSALEAVGARASDVEGHLFWRTSWWDGLPGVQARLQASIAEAASGRFMHFETEHWGGGRGRELIRVDLSIRPVRAVDSSRVEFLLAEGRDITELHCTHADPALRSKELRALYERLTQLDALKTRFFANLSHELRTPLALVLGPVDQLLASPELGSMQREALTTASRNARVLLRHINDLLDLAQLEGGRESVRWARGDLAALVRLTASYFAGTCAERGIELGVACPPLLSGYFDAEKVQRILLNLLANALKFTPSGGRVGCSVELQRGAAVIEVTDTGPGVPAHLREAVFERFVQGEPDGTRRFAGIGLGLAIAREFTRLHGGDIAVEDAPGGGSRFRILLPLESPPGAAVSGISIQTDPEAAVGVLQELAAYATAPAPEPELPHGGVLVIEDNPEMARFVADVLRPLAPVAVAADGASGLALAERRVPDLIVTDMMMPGLGGEELVRRLRSGTRFEGVPILVLTARNDDELRVRLLRGGAQDFLMKPFSADELRARASNLLKACRVRALLRRELESGQQDLEDLAHALAGRRHELERALETARVSREQAERASRLKTELLNLVSHELRTPLTAIQLQLQRLLRDRTTPPADRQREVLERMVGSSKRLASMIDSLLERARLESGRLSVETCDIDVMALAADVLEELSPQAENKGLRLRLTCNPGLPPACSDARLLRLCLVNVVGNAVRFTARGEVHVTLAHSERGHLLEIRDTGPGIAEADRARIFEPFWHSEPVRRKHQPGMGLGLALVRQSLEAIRGRIEVESETGVGTLFRIVLPPPECRRGSLAATSGAA